MRPPLAAACINSSLAIKELICHTQKHPDSLNPGVRHCLDQRMKELQYPQNITGSLLRSMGTPFPLSEVLVERAMRLYTDGKRAVLGKSMGIEIGGAHDGRNST